MTLLEATQALQRVARLAVQHRLLSPLEALWWLAAATLEVIQSRSLALRWLVLVLAVLALTAVGGCGSQTRSPSPAVVTPLSKWPSDADYRTLASARATVRQALTERDWRRKAGAAEYGLLAMMTLHSMEPGPCASLVAHTYAELMDLRDAYRGEDWRPMVAVVRSDPSLVSRCRPRAADTSRLGL